MTNTFRATRPQLMGMPRTMPAAAQRLYDQGIANLAAERKAQRPKAIMRVLPRAAAEQPQLTVRQRVAKLRVDRLSCDVFEAARALCGPNAFAQTKADRAEKRLAQTKAAYDFAVIGRGRRI